MSLEFDPIRFSPESSAEKLEMCKCTNNTSCECIYEHGMFEWSWDRSFVNPRLILDESTMEIQFHPGYSIGTAAIRGNKSMARGRHHYWEVEMVTAVYGTDVMVGVGTAKADLLSTSDSFCSLLGRDSESWGYSYKGYIQHRGETREYASQFKQGSLIGVHLDAWRGCLQFFLDRKPLGIAFTGLKGLELYPMICSTAAKSKMRVTYSCSVPASLQMECLSVLLPTQREYLSTAFPGLKHLSKSVFADILKKEDSDSKEEVHECPAEYLILDELDYALVGCKKIRKKRRLLKKPGLKSLALRSN